MRKTHSSSETPYGRLRSVTLIAPFSIPEAPQSKDSLSAVEVNSYVKLSPSALTLLWDIVLRKAKD